MSQPIYDVCIVGAGPAGASAAYLLGESGMSVLLIDKCEFPRAKPCAGGLTIKAIQALPYSIEPVIRKTCNKVVIGNINQKSTVFNSKLPLCVMTIRSEFDAFCLEKTLEKGAKFEVHSKIISINSNDEIIEIKTSNSIIYTKYLIGADGTNSVVRKLTNTFVEAQKGTAIEGKVYLHTSQMPELKIDFGMIKNGYYWIFQKNDHVNIGLYTYSPNEKISRKKLLAYAFLNFKTNDVKEIEGHHLGINTKKYTPISPNIFLVGDAAGLVDSLLGEGIYSAIKSGQYAAKAIINAHNFGTSALDDFRTDLHKMQKDLDICQNSADWFYNNRKKGYLLLTLPPVKYCLMKGFASGLTFSETKRGFLKLFFNKPKAILTS